MTKLYVDRPVINSVRQPFIENTYLDRGVILDVYGQNLSEVFCVYLNSIWEKECVLQNISDEEVRIIVPEKYKEEVLSLTIQLEKKINNEITLLSNKANVRYIEDDSMLKPIITGTLPESLALNNIENKVLRIIGQNFNENAKVSVNEKEYETNYIDKSNLEIAFPYSDWCLEKSLSVKILYESTDQEFIDELASEPWTVRVVGNRDNELVYDWIEHRAVAHAFGAYNEKTYTNSLEAFKENYEKGFRVFEVDMTFASDDVLLLKHDWWRETLQSDTTFDKYEINNLPKSFEEMRSATKEYTVLSFDDLCKIMEEYPDIYIITDTKDTNSHATNEIFGYIVEHAKKYNESVLNRLIVQIYNEQMYYQVMNVYPFRSIVYTLYQTNASNETVLDFVKDTGIKVVGMFESRMSDSFVNELNRLGVYIYVYTINDMATANGLLQKGVYGIYTDYLLEEELELRQIQSRQDLRSIDTIENYIEQLNKQMEMIMILSVRGDTLSNSNEQLEELLCCCGAKEALFDGNETGYVLLANSGEAFYEEKSLDKLIEYKSSIGTSELAVVSGGGDKYEAVSSIVIDGIDYSPNQSGLNIVVYDTKNQLVYDIINYDLNDENMVTRYDSLNMKNKKETEENLRFMLKYLEALENENYLVLFSVNDEAGSNFIDEIKERWKKLGFKQEIGYRKSFIGILNKSECVFEESSDEALVYDDFINGLHIQVKSLGFEAGCFSSIKINEVEYSKNTRGINIVVFDLRRNVVIDIITFDLYDKYTRNYS